ncbi:hypothetical protein C1N53_18550 [Pontibacter sp. SGAir0037]|nr:hypothetical protein C1N53_18550 [Pontibacter sp. SGAir0037]
MNYQIIKTPIHNQISLKGQLMLPKRNPYTPKHKFVSAIELYTLLSLLLLSLLLQQVTST